MMTDLIERAREFATQAHQRIGQRRKYTNQPYDLHLAAVAKLVGEVADDVEMVAAAWLHDTVEDTPATLDDIEKNFGVPVAELVEELTDISKASDGNRAKRKELDRIHSSQASTRAKTVKLADLIDNCKDIRKNDERFAWVYLSEMGALLKVLSDGDAVLFKRASKLHAKFTEQLGGRDAVLSESDDLESAGPTLQGMDDRHFRRMFVEIFTAKDLAEGLLSFDDDSPCEQVKRALKTQRREVASVRISGSVQGYVRMSDLGAGLCADKIKHFTVDQVVNSSATFGDVIHVLTRHDFCFVTVLDNIAGVISRDDVNKPMARMWLFGIVTIVEQQLLKLILERFPNDSWQQQVSAGRMEKAREIQSERQRRNVYCELIDCLQLSDKAQIVIQDPVSLERLGLESKSVAKKTIKRLESLRNHLAHAQDIVTHDWPQIARLSMWIEDMTRK
ncbi:Guanosine-3',5'-bis(diphosphate) 3'-pyrophosphohydrolase / GTP pyrophosphokinase, (p)ppGpp synthetase II [hydrothermal vent metagenome]|uniref:Guanosine-3',5'-bis(Diphosphate) 3'-pyrophosphohydrolase / GTP pyrophosphokinase, (P)ppGpp synthetase II n=1 Tax=hydrothermal vent metagenome TaxID=652676 RepID=A0A3B0ZB19_9ZZZZ